MKIRPTITLLAALSALQITQPAARADEQPAPAATNAVTVNRDTVAYAIGVNVGMNLTNNLNRAHFDVNKDEIVAAIKDVFAGTGVKMTPQQAGETIQTYQKQLTTERAEKNLKAGEAFLAENKTKPGVQTKEVALPDGKTAELQYKIITEGEGESPKAGDTVKVQYRGTLVDGTEFDGTDRRGNQPATFRVDGVIRGWTEALEMMKPGAKWEVYIPAELAYGNTPRPGIEPGSTLIFEVELLEIVKPAAQSSNTTSQPKPLTSDIIMVPSADQMKAGSNITIIKASDLEKSNAVHSATSATNK